MLAACGSARARARPAPPPAADRRRARARATSASSSASGGSGGSLTLGTKDFTEEFIVGQLYKQALTAKGCKVNYKENIGATEVVDKALTSGQIDAYPEYTGESVATVAKINKTVSSPQQEYALAKAFYAKRGQVMSSMTPFFDTDAIAVTKAFATKYGLVTTADLKKVPHFTLGARPEFLNRHAGRGGHEERLRGEELHLQVARPGHPVPGARRRFGGRDRRVHHRPAAGQRASTWCSRTRRTSSASRTSRWSSTRTRSTRAPSLLSTVDSVNKLLTNVGHHRHEQGGRDRPSAAGRCGRGLPEGQPVS